jgi:glucose/arabinose dehydrogenase
VPRTRLAGCILAIALVTGGAAADPAGPAETLPPSVPVGFTITPAALSLTATSLAFSPDGGTLYVTSLLGRVFRMPVVGGVVAGPPTVFVEGLNQPLGVVATEDAVFIADSVLGTPRSLGLVLRATDADGTGAADAVETVISELPNGRHNTNGMAIGADGMLYITNGNSTDSGFADEGGAPEVRPYSGSVLRVDPAATNLTPSPEMVVATGWRNIYDIAFLPSSHPAATPGTMKAAVPMNGPDGLQYPAALRPAGEDTLSIFDAASDAVEHFGFPWCLYDRANGGLNGFMQDASQGACDPLPAAASNGLATPVLQAKPSALFGLHVSANGLAFNPNTSFPADNDHDLFVAEFGNFFGNTPVGHKVVRVRFAADGSVSAVEDFMTGILPLDLTFAPDGALWVADTTGLIYRIAGVLPR